MQSTNQNLDTCICSWTHIWISIIKLLHTTALNQYCLRLNLNQKSFKKDNVKKCKYWQNVCLFDKFIYLQQHYMKYFCDDIKTKVFSNITWINFLNNISFIDIICTQLSCCMRSTWSSITHNLKFICLCIQHVHVITFSWEWVMVTFELLLYFPPISRTILEITCQGVNFGRGTSSPT